MDPTMIANLAGSGLEMVNNVGRSALGIYQMIKGAKMNPLRPEYNIPDAVGKNVSMAENEYGSRMAGARSMEDNIRSSQAGVMGKATEAGSSSSQILSMLAGTQGGSNRAYEGLGVQEAQDKERKRRELSQALMQLAGAQDKEWKLNEFDPYLDEANTKAALTSAGMQNMFGGSQSQANAFARYGNMDEPGGTSVYDTYDQYSNGGNDFTPPTTQGMNLQDLKNVVD